MKKSKFFSSLLLVALIVLSVFSGCAECKHTYDHGCDTTCNECGLERNVNGHKYDNDCDADCNKCGATREVRDHYYASDCDTVCDSCGMKREGAEHTYGNACDRICDLCNAMRNVEGHSYDNDCDADCNECGVTREVGGHEYSFVCDVTCDICGGVREAEAHSYSAECDDSCNVCGELREIETEHSYAADCSTHCGVCGDVRADSVAHTYSDNCDADCDVCLETRTNINHRWSAWESNNDATCDKDGTKTRKCSLCKLEDIDTDVGTAFGHWYPSSEYVYNNDATHTKDGTESIRCYLCNYAKSTRTSVGSAGHSFNADGECTECGWSAPDLSAYMTYESFEAYNKANGAFVNSSSNSITVANVGVSVKDGVTYTVVKRSGIGYSNIRALKVARAASQTTSNNDPAVNVVPSGKSSAKHVIEFDIMIGASNGSNIYFKGRKNQGTTAIFNEFVWYNDADKSVRIGDTIVEKGVADGEWYSIAIAIDDEAKTYEIYVEGQLVPKVISYENSDYYSHSEMAVGLYRFTSESGKTAVEFYVDNIAVYNGEYRAK